MQTTIENRFYDLLGRKLAGDSSASELEELESILQNHPELQTFYSQLLMHSSEMPDADVENAYLTHREKMYPAPELNKTQPRGIVIRRYFPAKRTLVKMLAAASVIAILGVTWLLINKNPAPGNKQIIVETGTNKESKSVMTLPDGSIVRLNAKSKVSYAEGFAKSREVYLEGEAYFEVAHNEHIPFIVHTGEADIKVLGTRFNVRNYANEHRMEAALLTGSIELTLREDNQQKILLKPSDKIIVKKKTAGDAAITPAAGDDKIERTSIQMQDSVIVETSWLNDKLAFSDKPFSEIAKDLERKFDVTIEFKNQVVSRYKYTGVYEEDNAEEILKILQMIKPFHYNYNNRQIIIY